MLPHLMYVGSSQRVRQRHCLGRSKFGLQTRPQRNPATRFFSLCKVFDSVSLRPFFDTTIGSLSTIAKTTHYVRPGGGQLAR